MKKLWKLLYCVLIFVGLHTAQAFAQPLETKAQQALVLDFHTGHVLLEKNADARVFPASMTKLMTVYVAFKRLQSGSLRMDDMLNVSTKAWRKGGSRMFLEPNTEVSIEDLLRGILVQSGNDAAIVLA
ncbi:MAG: serine hydrolase, partial [Pseudomonadota bacterium]